MTNLVSLTGFDKARLIYMPITLQSKINTVGGAVWGHKVFVDIIT